MLITQVENLDWPRKFFYICKNLDKNFLYKVITVSLVFKKAHSQGADFSVVLTYKLGKAFGIVVAYSLYERNVRMVRLMR